MNKKLLAVAVAGALAAPGLALAQSSVTISGTWKVSLESLNIGQRAGATNKSETRISDDSSRIIFNVVEDLGGGLQAIGQADFRFQIAGGTAVANSGNSHVGLRSKSMGRVIIGRQDVHYFNTESSLAALAGDLRADAVSLMAFAGGGGAVIANASRQPNIIHYTTPNFGGFTAIVGYSTAGNGGAQADLTSTVRKGNSLVINPNFAGSNFQVGWSYWNAKGDGGGVTAATGDQKANRLYGSFSVAGFKLGLAWDKSRITNTTTGVDLSNRTAWTIPLSYIMGNNQFHFHYTKARDDTATAAVQDGAKMVALSYQRTLSKRTSVGLTYAKITNDIGATYQLFTSASLGNSAGAAIAAGEDPRIMAATIRHAF